MGFFDSVGGFFKDAGHWVKGAAESVWDTVSGTASTVYNDAKGIVTRNQDTIDKTVSTVGNVGNNVVTGVSDSITGAEDVAKETVSGIGNFLSGPGLLVLAGGLYILMSR